MKIDMKSILRRTAELYFFLFMLDVSGSRGSLFVEDHIIYDGLFFILIFIGFLITLWIFIKNDSVPTDPPGNALAAFFLFSCSFLLSTEKSINMDKSLDGLYFLATGAILFVFILYMIYAGWSYHSLMSSFMTTGILYNTIRLIEFQDFTDRWMMVPNKTAALACLFGLVALAYIIYWKRETKVDLVVPVLTLISSLVVIGVTGSRGALIGFLSGSIVMVLPSLPGRKKVIIYLVIALVLISSVLIQRNYIEAWTISISGRIDTWKACQEAWSKKPWLGYGPNTFSYVMPNLYPGVGWNKSHAHNLAIHALFELGIIGLSAFTFLLFSLVQALVKMESWTVHKAAALGVMVMLLVYGLVDLPFLEPVIMRYMIVIVAGALAMKGREAPCINTH